MTHQNTKPGPLDGIKVLDLSRILAGPTCTQLLGDYGADVIKIERPGLGDDTRGWGPPYVVDASGAPTNESAYYLSSNRNKRSVAIDITTTAGSDTVRKLAKVCDIVVENFKCGGLAKYGLDFKTLHAINPRLIYCSITGYGQTGPNAALPGYDLMAQGFGGIMSLTGAPDGEPMKVGVGIADVMCGMYATTAILAALHHRNQTKEGQHIDIALVDTQVAWLVNEGTNYLMSGDVPQRRGNQHPNIVPYQAFETNDGHILVAVGNDSQFQRFCKLIGQNQLGDDPQFSTNSARIANREALINILKPVIKGFRKVDLEKLMNANSVPCGPINDLAGVFASEQVAARDMKISMPHLDGRVDLIGNPVKFSKSPVSYRRAPPVCGADTDDVLADWLNQPKPRI